MTNRWAFLVGVNRYTDPNFGTLKFCVNDVLMLGQILTQLGYTVNWGATRKSWLAIAKLHFFGGFKLSGYQKRQNNLARQA